MNVFPSVEKTSEDALRNAVSIGGNTDTIAAIAGGIAEVMFGMPVEIAERARTYLTPDLAAVVDLFEGMTRERGNHFTATPGIVRIREGRLMAWLHGPRLAGVAVKVYQYLARGGCAESVAMRVVPARLEVRALIRCDRASKRGAVVAGRVDHAAPHARYRLALVVRITLHVDYEAGHRRDHMVGIRPGGTGERVRPEIG